MSIFDPESLDRYLPDGYLITFRHARSVIHGGFVIRSKCYTINGIELPHGLDAAQMDTEFGETIFHTSQPNEILQLIYRKRGHMAMDLVAAATESPPIYCTLVPTHKLGQAEYEKKRAVQELSTRSETSNKWKALAKRLMMERDGV